MIGDALGTLLEYLPLLRVWCVSQFRAPSFFPVCVVCCAIACLSLCWQAWWRSQAAGPLA